MTVTVGSKEMIVKEWLANKIANELQRNLYFDVYVFAILKETEKAVYAMLSVGSYQKKTMWVPKSALISKDVEQGDDRAVIYTDDYEKACELFKDHWDMYN